MNANIPKSDKKRIVVIGGGFAGLSLTKLLVKLNYQIVLIDKNNYHQFQPLLYQVATGGLEPGSISYPLRKIFASKNNMHIRYAEVIEVNSNLNQIHTSIGLIDYDYLVIATGAITNYFGNKDLEANCIGMKSVPEALDIRSLILQNYENAILCENQSEKEAFLNIVIVGAGPTGVELAGAFSEMKKHILPKDYPELDFNLMDIHLIESNERVLAGMSRESSLKAKDFLVKMGIKVQNNLRVLNFDGNTVSINNNTSINSKTVIWAAGVKGNSINGFSTEQLNKSGRYICDEYNRLLGSNNIFAIGDISCIMSEELPNGHPQLATVAMQQGDHLANNFKNILKNKSLEKFNYVNKGTMATIGRNKAVVELPKFKFSGYFAWILWMFIHLMSLVGFRNRVSVLVTWIYNYLNYEKALRLIIRPYDKSKK